MRRALTIAFILFFFTQLNGSVDTGRACNWKNRISKFDVWNNCDSQKNTVNVIGKILFNQNQLNCKIIRKWKISTSSTTVIGTGENLYYPVTKNGTYTVCISLYDSCNKCDTVLCKSTTINCFPGCNWKSKIDAFEVWNNCDSQKSHKNVIGRLYLTNKYTCTSKLYRKWMVNGTAVGYGEKLYYPVTKNGSYSVCLYLYDSCNKCDTTICKTTTISCFPACNWKRNIDALEVWNNCDSGHNTKHVLGRLFLTQYYKCSKKLYRKWTVNNTVVGNSEKLYYPITQNGTYNVCLYLYDSCENCDTVICKSTTVTCFGSKCNWKNRIDAFEVWNNCDSQKNHKNIIGKFRFKNYSCSSKLFRKWMVNSAFAGYGENLYYPVTKNGTYTVCMVLYDSCNKCDTSICATTTINCFPGCNWKNRIDAFEVWNNCDSQKSHKNIIGKFRFRNYSCSSKLFRKWTVDGSFAGYGENLYYPVTKNGTYTVCMILYDSCNRCDTAICKTTTINCFPGCNWKSKIDDFNAWSNCDSSLNHVNLIARYRVTQNYKCSMKMARKWLVNGVAVSHSEKLYYPVTKNGTYTVCLWLYDSCNRCDTSYCKTVTISCIKGRTCNWKSKLGGFDVRTNCDSNLNHVEIQGKFYLNSSYQCSKKLWRKWVVNNTVAGYGEKLYYPIKHSGTYTVCVVVYDSCNNCDTSWCKTLQVKCRSLSTDEESLQANVSVYPNPGSDLVFVQGTAGMKVVVMDVSGRLMEEVTSDLDGSIMTLNVRTLPAGVYILKVLQGESTSYIRFIKE